MNTEEQIIIINATKTKSSIEHIHNHIAKINKQYTQLQKETLTYANEEYIINQNNHIWSLINHLREIKDRCRYITELINTTYKMNEIKRKELVNELITFFKKEVNKI